MHKMDVPILLYLAQRHLLFNFHHDPLEQGVYYELSHLWDEKLGELFILERCPNTVESMRLHVAANITQCWHGTNGYALENLAQNGLASSCNADLGHNFLENHQGVYVTPKPGCAWGYATPQLLFQDQDLDPDSQRWIRFIVEIDVDLKNRIGVKKGEKDNVQWIFPGWACLITKIIIATNAPPNAGDYRFFNWDPSLEAGPVGTYNERIMRANGKWFIYEPPQPGAAPKAVGRHMLPSAKVKAKPPPKLCSRWQTRFDSG